MTQNLLGDGFVQRKEGARRTGPQIGAVYAFQHGLHEAVLTGSAMEVEHGEVMLSGKVEDAVEIFQQIAKRDFVPQAFQGFFHDSAASEGNLAFGGPSAGNQKNFHTYNQRVP